MLRITKNWTNAQQTTAQGHAETWAPPRSTEVRTLGSRVRPCRVPAGSKARMLKRTALLQRLVNSTKRLERICVVFKVICLVAEQGQVSGLV